MVVHDAWSVDSSSRATVHKVPESPVKITVPVGVPEPGDLGLTVAVNVTGSPTTGESSVEVMLVEVSSDATVNEICDEEDELSFESPLYDAVTDCDPLEG